MKSRQYLADPQVAEINYSARSYLHENERSLEPALKSTTSMERELSRTVTR
jgi:hypothetical protein